MSKSFLRLVVFVVSLGVLTGVELTGSSNLAFAGWESNLSQRFDIVETFDNVQDWTGQGYGDQRSLTGMPKKTDGSNSIWTYYSHWGNDKTAKWIGNHGSNNVWNGTGKSLRLDYNSSNGSLGPSRLGFTIGTSPSDGYASEVYVFFMTRYDPGFFPMSGNSFAYFPYLKTFEIGSGFRDVWNWGTVEEQSAAVNETQKRNIYGLNYNIQNFHSCNSGELCGKYNIRTAQTSSSGDTTRSYDVVATNAGLGAPIRNGSWFGVEYHYKLSSPHGGSTGLAEMWVYDAEGNIIGHDQRSGIVTFRDASMAYKHSINKFVLGGNRSGFEAASVDHMFVDDFIVNGGRIGPTYFSLLAAPAPAPVVLSPPTGLRIVN